MLLTDCLFFFITMSYNKIVMSVVTQDNLFCSPSNLNVTTIECIILH